VDAGATDQGEKKKEGGTKQESTGKKDRVKNWGKSQFPVVSLKRGMHDVRLGGKLKARRRPVNFGRASNEKRVKTCATQEDLASQRIADEKWRLGEEKHAFSMRYYWGERTVSACGSFKEKHPYLPMF